MRRRPQDADQCDCSSGLFLFTLAIAVPFALLTAAFTLLFALALILTTALLLAALLLSTGVVATLLILIGHLAHPLKTPVRGPLVRGHFLNGACDWSFRRLRRTELDNGPMDLVLDFVSFRGVWRPRGGC